MITDTRPMPPEHLHSQRCLAHALICAVENIRDERGQSAHDFRLRMQDGEALTQADDYLATGLVDCQCHSWDIAQETQGGDVWRAVCACGWSSEQWTTIPVDAVTFGQQHAAGMVSRAWELVSR